MKVTKATKVTKVTKVTAPGHSENDGGAEDDAIVLADDDC